MAFNEGMLVWGLVMRCLALCNIIHFLSFHSQIVGLIGDNGLHPAKDFFKRITATDKRIFPKYLKYPTIYWFSTSSPFLQLTTLLGALLSSLLLFYPTTSSIYLLSAILSLSLVNVLGPFNLLMEPMMVEVNFLCWVGCILANNNFAYLAVIAYRMYTFRVMLSAGLVKWVGSPKWKDLTAMENHYLTQPLPNPVSYYMHNFPSWVHKGSTLASLVAEIPISFLTLLPFWQLRVVGLITNVGLMAMINFTGNYGHLGFLTSAISLSLLDDWMVSFLSPPTFAFRTLPSFTDSYACYFALALLALYTVASIFPLCEAANYRCKIPFMRTIYIQMASLCILNPYGMFGAMHDKRWELVIEGSNDDKEWKRYLFYFKTSAPDQPPTVVWPLGLWPRVDWHLWLIPLHLQRGNALPPPWFMKLLAAVLEGQEDVLPFFKVNPFPNSPPKYIRVLLCDYSFTKPGSANYWVEQKLGTYGGEVRYDRESLWTFGIDATKNIPQIKSTGSYKLSM